MTEKIHKPDETFKLNPQQIDVVDKETLTRTVASAKNEIRSELNDTKKQYIEIFGIFAAIITFLGIEVQAFNKISTFSKLAGFTSFLISNVLYLIYSIGILSSSEKKGSFTQDYNNKILIIGTIFFALSLTFFWYSVSGKVFFWTVQLTTKV